MWGGHREGEDPGSAAFPSSEEIPWNSLEANPQEFRGPESVQNAAGILKNPFLIQFILHFVKEIQQQSSERAQDI